MLIRQDGTSMGSIGGGCVEAQVWETASEVIKTSRAQILEYQMTDDDLEEDGLVCGGQVEIFVEPILTRPQLVVLGAGHVGQAIARIAARIDFRVTVIDDRDRFVSEERFPTAERRMAQPYDQSLDDLHLPADSFILIVTRGHRHDQQALETALNQQVTYTGLIGSRRKIKLLVDHLLEQGYPPEHFRNLYAPIGLEIGSETPREIAVSVAAELIALRKGAHRRSPKQQFIHDYLSRLEPKASETA
jgi:xanthine dehydrogenase accessory factor